MIVIIRDSENDRTILGIVEAEDKLIVKKALDKLGIPVYYLDTEYTREDVGQMKTRVEAFLEMLTARVDF